MSYCRAMQQGYLSGFWGVILGLCYLGCIGYHFDVVGLFMRFGKKALWIVSCSTVEKHMRTKGKPWVGGQKIGVFKKSSFGISEVKLTNF